MTAQALIKCDASSCPELPEGSLWNILYFSGLRGQFLLIFDLDWWDHMWT